jgi:catechol 2,3-dioxygenase
MMTANADGPVAPAGLDHVVINVSDMETSHRFWTAVVGLKHVADFALPRQGRGPMRFYRGVSESRPHHHHIALVEVPALPGAGLVSAIGHIAFVLPDRESWVRQLEHLRSSGVAFQCVEHGMSHSVYFQDPDGYKVELLYELPRGQWEQDVGAALNHYVIYSEDDATAPQSVLR